MPLAATLGRRTEDEFCEFELDGERFLMIEPFGDSGRFRIVSDPPAPEIAIENVRGFFARAPAIDWPLGQRRLRRMEGSFLCRRDQRDTSEPRVRTPSAMIGGASRPPPSVREVNRRLRTASREAAMTG